MQLKYGMEQSSAVVLPLISYPIIRYGEVSLRWNHSMR